ncbi:MAG TPA: hypothetical protein VMR43_19400 [Variovorax sp.]|nr:hypothetical protein [Variovorax sp.]
MRPKFERLTTTSSSPACMVTNVTSMIRSIANHPENVLDAAVRRLREVRLHDRHEACGFGLRLGSDLTSAERRVGHRRCQEIRHLDEHDRHSVWKEIAIGLP